MQNKSGQSGQHQTARSMQSDLDHTLFTKATWIKYSANRIV